MLRAARRFHAFLAAPALLFAACIDAPIEGRADAAPSGNANGNGNGNGNGEECSLENGNLEPQTFESMLADLEQSCGGGSCHGPGSPFGFEVHGGAYLSGDADEHCDFVASLESFLGYADLADPGQSQILQVIDGRVAHRGGTLEPDQEPRPSMEAYLEAIAGGGNGDGAPGLDEFESEIQPILDNAGNTGCIVGGACHENGAGGFTLNAQPAPASGEMRANYDQVIEQSNPADPESSELVSRAEASHFGSPQVSAAERDTLIAWIASLGE